MRHIQPISEIEPGDGASTQHAHHWVVFSTALSQVALIVECAICGATGTVDDPTEKEWGNAFNAPSRPYRWRDDSRVTVRSGPQP